MNIENFVREETRDYDSSHDYYHAKTVVTNIEKILTEIDINYLKEDDFDPKKIIIMAGWLHDICDHKYNYSVDKLLRLHQFIWKNSNIKEAEMIIKIIDNISYRREVEGKMEYFGKYQILRDIVSDADKLEALGETGLERCRIFGSLTIKDNNELEKKIKKHCYEKLLKLKSGYIRTPIGKKLAEPLHQIILDYVQK